ncbi:MAG TPA: PKD domain-containing protein [Saprospiraceae bacterium]|nr:PKD domain-containing protein [Saprospiraceae bacterium]
MLSLKLKYLIFFYTILCCSIGNIEAKHIIGGVMSYECLGNDEYKITLKIYRDCAGGGPPFDGMAQIGIYRCGNTIDCTSLGQIDAILKPKPEPTDILSISPPVYKCLKVPPNVCVQEATYEFTTTLSLSNESYFIVYQRCCRNNTISNIVDPANTGATFMVEITPDAQSVCNNSPIFNNFPPTLICANQMLEFDHSATDKDGDQLVYSLCSPLEGAGNFSAGNGCNSDSPSPACPPPFDNVQFILPVYSFDKPLGQNSPINIDPFTGKLTVKPSTLGQFIVGVCVSEYRNGKLLSTIRRDFQFNVANCQPNVLASIQNDFTIGPKKFVINSCGIKTIQFVNKSWPPSEIKSYDWVFPEGVPMNSTTEDVTVSFPHAGIFSGYMILNKANTCPDTSEIFVNIFPEIHAKFNADYDTCRAEPVIFTDQSIVYAGKVKSWYWDFGDMLSSKIKNPYNAYKKPGIYQVKLKIVDMNGCADSIGKIVKYYPVPPLINIQPSSFIGCVPGTVVFTNLSKPIDNTYKINWNFGDGTNGSQISPTHIYDSAGVYTITLDITSPIGCKTSETFNSYITIEPKPIADFVYTPDDPSNFNPQIQFKDLSSGSAAWVWDFGDGGYSIQRNPFHIYADTGLFVITQYVTHKSGCVESLSKIIDIKPVITYYLPNAFTPNGDGTNDEFKGMGNFLGMEDFEMTIWNRWGEKIFVSTDPTRGWDGRINNVGSFVHNGVYVCTVKYKGPRNKNYELSGYATVVR